MFNNTAHVPDTQMRRLTMGDKSPKAKEKRKKKQVSKQDKKKA